MSPTGRWFCAHAADLRSAERASGFICNTVAAPAFLLPMAPQRNLAAATRRPRTCGRQNAPLVLFVTLSRLTRPSYPLRRNAVWQRALPAILFSQERDAKVIQGEPPLDIPLMRLAAFPPVWAAIFPRFAGARPEGVPRSIRKNRRLPPKLPTLLAESKMRSRFHLRHCPRCPHLCCD